MDRLAALSPLDGRYGDQLSELANIMSEGGLFQVRLQIEARWLLFLDQEIKKRNEKCQFQLTVKQYELLNQLKNGEIQEAAKDIKDLEKSINHDVKAVEYYLRKRLVQCSASSMAQAFIHFACTSEDINNLAYALILKKVRSEILQPYMDEVQDTIKTLAKRYAGLGMLALTHGQSATPTTLGKELAVFGSRLSSLQKEIETSAMAGKFNGAVGCYNAHVVAFPEWDWPKLCADFVQNELQLQFNPLTTQIESHDWLVLLCAKINLYNSISIGFCQDMWGYISRGYFKLQLKEQEVGSSTMPHKVNPIDFENAEGNFGLANALGDFFFRKLPISRFQRDLSDSTVLRSLSSYLGYHTLAQKSLIKGLKKLKANEQKIQEDLSGEWQILGEALQTLLRKAGYPDAYERVKTLTRGQDISQKTLMEFAKAFPEINFAQLSPLTYTGLGEKLAEDYYRGI